MTQTCGIRLKPGEIFYLADNSVIVCIEADSLEEYLLTDGLWDVVSINTTALIGNPAYDANSGCVSFSTKYTNYLKLFQKVMEEARTGDVVLSNGNKPDADNESVGSEETGSTSAVSAGGMYDCLLGFPLIQL